MYMLLPKKLLLVLLLCSLSFYAVGQISIQGLVKDEQGMPMSDVMVMLVKKGSEEIITYATSNAQGQYSIKYNGKEDSLHVKVSRFDYKTQLISVANRSQQLDFRVKSEVTVLKEVTIRPKNVWRNRDTVNYSVGSFAEQNDRTIADVLKKMPGIDIQASGAISYNGKAINKFYVEGLDLMGGKYNVVSENLGHKSVQTVQVLENHESVKALEEVSTSDQAAINLVLKDEAKSKWLVNGKLGVGFTPFLWDDELTLMRFAKTDQDVMVYKTNNVGNNVAGTLINHYGFGGSQRSDLLSVPFSSPGVPESRYLFNNAHLITANRLWKINDQYQLRLNVDYLHDRQTRNNASHSVYFLDGEQEVVTDEQSHAELNINRAGLAATLTGNHKKYFLENILDFRADWSNTQATVSNSEQSLELPFYSISDNFRWLKVLGKKRLDIQTINTLSNTPQSLTIKPGPYPDFFNEDIPYEWLKQDASQLNFISNSSVNLSTSLGHWQMGYSLGLEFTSQQLTSDLHVANQVTADSLRNDFGFVFARPYISANGSYITKKFNASLALPVGYTMQHTSDPLNYGTNDESQPYFNPSLTLRYQIGYQWTVSSSAGYSKSFSTLSSLYTGYLLSNYRSIQKNSGVFSGSNSQSYSLSLRYNEPLKSLNASISASYGRTQLDKISEVEFDDILAIRKTVPYNGYNDSKQLSLTFSKGFNRYITKADLMSGYGISTSSQLQRDVLITSEGKTCYIILTLNGKISSFLNCTYSVTYNNYKSAMNDGYVVTDLGTISSTNQGFQLNIFPTKTLLFCINMNYNQSVTASGLPSTFFMDLRGQYKLKRWEFNVHWNNILNADEYIIASSGAFYSSVNAYELRPWNIILSMRFSL